MLEQLRHWVPDRLQRLNGRNEARAAPTPPTEADFQPGYDANVGRLHHTGQSPAPTPPAAMAEEFSWRIGPVSE